MDSVISEGSVGAAGGSPGDQFVRTLHAEWGKAWSVRPPLLWLVLAAGMAVGIALTLANDFIHSVSTGEEPAASSLDAVDVFGPVVSFAQIAVAGFALHLVTPEYTSGSIVPTFTAQPRRWLVVLAKSSLAGFTAVLLGLILGPVSVVGIELVAGDRLGEALPLGVAAGQTAGVFGTAAVIAVGLAFLTRSAVGALATAFLLLLVSLAVPAESGFWLPGVAAGTFVTGGPADYPPIVGLVILVGWAIGTVVTATIVVNRRDA